MRQHGLTTVFANPGSTEVPFLGGLPEDMRFVLGLHESAVVGMATGWAIARREAAFVLVHTTAGLGNAVSALATARVNRAPLVVLVGQQDRRHLAQEPFLAGRLAGLAGDYPVWVAQPARAQDVPGALARARHEAEAARGPALVIVPMDDWLAPAPEPHEIAAPAVTVRDPQPDPAAIERLAAMIDEAARPALVVGAGADSEQAWSRARGARGETRLPGLAGVVRRPRRLPAGSPAVRGPPAGRPRATARGALRPRSRAGRGRACVPPVPVRAGSARGRRDPARARDRRPGRGAPQPGGARRGRRSRGGLRGARGRGARAHGGEYESQRAAPLARSAGGRRAAPRRTRAERARRAARARRRS